ncbi:phage minor head protein [Streptomyces sp. NPDC046332]|uniref:phage minor head protein n=1 Tax=unclassified Streptomyces TaxID=2593676 RepID=UPI0033D454E9
MSTPIEDPGLPRRLRAQAFIREGEQRIGRTWFRSLTRWLDRVRPSVTRGGGVDPGRVSDHQAFWTEQVNVEVMPVVGGVLGNAWRRVTEAGEPAGDPWVARYLNEAGNRLVRLPDEVYALIVAEVERGIREQQSIPDITAAVQTVLTASGSERWPNRARTVARTETIGAVNAGVFRAAELDAEQRGDPAPFKVWIATEDRRTRPTHDEADGQRTLLREPFRVGASQLLFPGDPRGAAAEVINCRCSMLPVVLGEEIDWTDRQEARRG